MRYYEVHRSFMALTYATFGGSDHYPWAEPQTYRRRSRLITQHTGIDTGLPAVPPG